MAVIRTEAQLEAAFLNNDEGDISAFDGQDFIATFFGLATTTDPGPNNDSQDTAGIGAWFSAGSRWLNVNTQTEWICFDGTPGLAVWRHPSYFGNTPTIVTAGSGIHVDFLPPSTYEVSTTGTALPQFYTAVIAIPDGTPLSGLAPIAGYTPLPGDRILTWDQLDHKTCGIWIASAGLWTRAADFPAGLVVNGLAFVWVPISTGTFNSAPCLFTIGVQQQPTPVAPAPWTVGTDAVLIAYATPVSFAAGLAPISVSFGVNPQGACSIVVALTGPVPPSQLGPGSIPSGTTLPAPQLTAGGIPAGVTLPAPQLTAGGIPSGVLLPASQLTGSVSPGNLPTLDGIASSSGYLNPGYLSPGALNSGVTIAASQVIGGGTGTGFTFVPSFTSGGTNQATAALLTTMTITAITAWGGTANAILPTSPGLICILNSTSMGQTIWCPVGGTLNGTLNGNQFIAGNSARMFFSADGTNWAPEF